MSAKEFAFGVAVVVVGVIAAGLVMNYAYGKVPLIEDASDGFDM